ncbi:hypothetical protein KI387_015193, partial [Taxus chinensis]
KDLNEKRAGWIPHVMEYDIEIKVTVRQKSDKRAWESTSDSSAYPTSRGRAETAGGGGIQ